ncbi:MAG: MoxR family ATPase [Candidatus Omnitrophica bacterium]|nr:MoxR family ATPase [Candidatus Omnitrophota bacterium]
MNQDVRAIHERVESEAVFVRSLLQELEKAIVGQSEMLRGMLIALLADGHVLLEGVPGLAKTLAIRSLAQAVQTKFQRIQFTPDLLPADLLGTLIYNPKTSEFTIKKGPLFSNIVLADEINRAPAKVQAALLECMQERQITLGETTFRLEEPFLVLATQNPIEQEGTYPLPEAQVDRFMLKIVITYPNKEEEKQILERMSAANVPAIAPVVSPQDLIRARGTVNSIYMDDKVRDYIVDLVLATREPEKYGLDIKQLIAYGASPRATVFMARAAKAHAFLEGRAYVTPDDVKSVAMSVLRHRVIITYEAEAEELNSDAVVRRVLDGVEVP